MAAAVSSVVRLSKIVENVLAVDQLTVAQFRILDRLADGSTHGRGLAEWLAVKPPSLTALVDGLVKRGLVSRSEDPTDRRQVTHALTDVGQELHTVVSERIAARLDTILASAGDAAAVSGLIDALARWAPALDAFGAAKRRGVVSGTPEPSAAGVSQA